MSAIGATVPETRSSSRTTVLRRRIFSPQSSSAARTSGATNRLQKLSRSPNLNTSSSPRKLDVDTNSPFVSKYSVVTSPKRLISRSQSSSAAKAYKASLQHFDFVESDGEESDIEQRISEMFKQAQEQVESEKSQEPLCKQINYCRFGRYEIRAWYPSPYPESLAHLNRVYICEFCLKCLSNATLLRRHAAKCIWRYPPGNEIYRDKTKNISFWEVNGKIAKIYCQNLCLLAKLFLDHKTLYFDVEPFLFYVLTEADANGCHMIGYFSKEKESSMNCNLSCLLILPPFMRRGYGRYLIEFSYLLSKLENKIGSPEHPLSDMGLLTYRNYWKDAIFEHLDKVNKERVSVSIKDISLATGIHPNDIVSTLQFLGMIKYWKGQYVLDKKPEVFEEYLAKRTRRQKLKIDPRNLRWTPGESLD